jgi:acyl carrier protein
MPKTTFESVSDIIIDQLGVRPELVKPEATANDLAADSLDVLEVLMAIEEEFDLEIPDEDAEKMKTITDLVTYLNQRKDHAP